MAKFIPTYYAANIYEVDPTFFKEIGIETLLLDLDNTLASYKELTANEQTLAYLAKLEALGIKVILVSNNSGKRVRNYAKSANLPFISGARKPFTGKTK